VTEAFILLSSRLLLASMPPLAASICIDFNLVSWLIVGRAWVASAAAGLFALFLTLWFVLPRSRLLLRLVARGDLEPAGNPARG
jgi:hypothetical protein